MKRLNIFFILLMVSMCLVGFKHDTIQQNKEVKDSVCAYTDITSPVISFKNEEGIILAEGTELVLRDFVEVSDEISNVNVTSFGKLDVDEPGTYIITILAIDSCQNMATELSEVKVVTTEEYAEIEAQRARQRIIDERDARIAYRQEMMEYLENNYDETLYNEVYSLATAYIGMEGQCVEVAIKFLNNYRGSYTNLSDSYQISYEDARPGDIIEYADGGNGLWHVAVYLGNGQALHGNWKGRTVISSVVVSKATDPIFKRLY